MTNTHQFRALRVMLALAILIRKGVVQCSTNLEFYYVKKGLAPLSLIFFGYYERSCSDPRTMHVPKKHDIAMAPMLEEMHARLTEQGAPQRIGFNTVKRSTKQCTCSGFIYRGTCQPPPPPSMLRV